MIMNKLLLVFLTLIVLGPQAKSQIDINGIDSIVQNAFKNASFEGTVLIGENGNVLYQKSFGFKDKDREEAIENSSRFSIASITKLFTAIAILQLVEEGKFKLSDNLNELLPGYEIPGASEITIHHLLLHISGLPNEKDNIYKASISPQGFVSETLKNKSNAIGEFNYANIDYVLLGLIIEKFDNCSYEQSIQKRIVEKYAMNQTGFLKRGQYPENFAYSFSYDSAATREADPLLYIENYYAAGQMYSTAQDLLKLDQALYDDDFLNEKSKEAMFTSYPEYNYSGYSVWTYNYPFAPTKPKVMERRGGIKGANSVLIRFLDSNKSIIILSNNNYFNPDSFGNTQALKEALMIKVDESR